jgi:hypothetical protein
MNVSSEHSVSLWMKTSVVDDAPALDRDEKADVQAAWVRRGRRACRRCSADWLRYGSRNYPAEENRSSSSL